MILARSAHNTRFWQIALTGVLQGSFLFLSIASVGLTTQSAVAQAQPARHGGSMTLSVGGAQLIQLPRAAGNVMIADPTIMDVQYTDNNGLFIFGKKPGHTTLIVLDQSGQKMISGDVTVMFNMDAMRTMIAKEGGRNVQLQMSPDGVVLSGSVADAKAAAHLEALARQYGGSDAKLINRLTIGEPVQVNLVVRVAEVQRQLSQDLGFNWTTVFNGVGSFAIGAATGGLSGVPSAIKTLSSASNALSGSYTNGGSSVTGTLDAMATEGLATMLAEPNLTTMSGETAKFLSGGQFPVPIPQGLGTVGITYKNYGVSVDFTPTVLSDGTISMHVAPEVSSVSTEASDGAYSISGSSVVPAIRTNRADTTIQLASGQSFAIGGLISNDASNTISKVPGLGDIPVLGSLFRSASFQRNESELLIVVTAYIVHPSDRVPALPTDYIRPTSAIEALLLRRSAAAATDAPDATRMPHLQGAAGFLYE